MGAILIRGKNSILAWGFGSWKETSLPLEFWSMAIWFSFFKSTSFLNISPYFAPLTGYIKDFANVLFPEGKKAVAMKGNPIVHSTATLQDVINILKAVLQDDKLIKDHQSALSVLSKHLAPGDLVSLSGWDPVEAPRNPSKAKPQLIMTPTKRRAKLLGKC